MLEETDIKRLTDALVSKAEFKTLDDCTVRLAGSVSQLDDRVGRLEENVEHIRYAVDGLVTSFDKMAKNIEDLRSEYIAIKLQLDRHEKWIQQIAQKTGVVLSM